ncbi:hypothetical protein GCM10009857_17940 [Agromyces soli]
MQQILDAVRSFDGVLVVEPAPGGPFPELAWGDAFFYHAPDGRMPERTQPYGTIVTKDYPDDTASRLDEPGRYRVNVHVDRATFRRVTGEDPRSLAVHRDFTAVDVLGPHPVYGPNGWLAVVNPSETFDELVALLRAAHEAARRRTARLGARRGKGVERA